MPLRVNPGMPRPKFQPPEKRKPGVVQQPSTYKDLQQGIDFIVEAVRPTLGPLPRYVMLENLRRQDTPELLDDGATIARRIIQIKPPSLDVGAMLIRHALWKMHLEVGDGTTTMAVIYQAILREGIRFVSEYGCNAMLLRSGLEKGAKAVVQSLRQEAKPLMGKERIANIARGMCQGDDEMAEILGEIFDIVGAEGLIVVEGGNRSGLEREYVEGTYWDISGWFSRLFVPDPAEKQVMFEDAALLISDLAITDPNLLVPVLEKCVKAGVKKLVIIAKEVSDSVTGLLVNNNRAKTIESMAVRTPRVQEMDQIANIEDIAVLTGGKVFYSAASKNFDDFQVENLGYARRAWASESQFGLFGGKGNPRLIRQHTAYIQRLLQKVEPKEENEKEKLQIRLGRLLGGTAILRVGGMVDSQREARKSVANRAIAGLRQGVRGGVVPGGGVAFLNAQAALVDLPAQNEDEVQAYRILSMALSEPLRTIAQNAGYQPDVILERIRLSPRGYGLDACSGKLVDVEEAGIVDAVLVLEKALEYAVSGAAMTLTTDVIVHRKKLEENVEP